MTEYEDLIKIAIGTMDKAITRKAYVGVALKTKDGNIFTGFNIETHIHKGYHAEEVALISALKAGYRNNDFEAIAIVCSFPGTFPACASCRSFLWEFTNPELKIVTFDITEQKGNVFTLKDLYPFPYPIEPGVVHDEFKDKGDSNQTV